MIHPRTLQSLEYGKVIHFIADLCISSMGREHVFALKPLPDAESAHAAFDLYLEACDWQASAASAAEKFALTAFPDARGVLDTIASEKSRPEGARPTAHLDLDAFWALREMLRVASRAYESICIETAAKRWPGLLARAQAAPRPIQFLAALNRCISDEGFLKDESSPELYRLRSEQRSLHQNCLRKVKDFAKQYNMEHYLQDDFMTLSSDRYVLPLKGNFKGRMRGIIHDWSQTGETCYFEPLFLVDINNRLQELKHEEREEERKILEYLTGLLTEEYEAVRGANDLLALIDFLCAQIRYADYLDCKCPAFTPDDQGVELVAARHPILAMARQNVPPEAAHVAPVRPLDITLRPGDRALVITGGNAGGKTVCLKTLGLITALAMSGLPVPVGAGSHLPWFDRMDAFIGDEQSLDDNVSTFTAQIDHLAKAWKHLDNRGLLLLDEFGAGTDPAEGAALAQAVLDGLLEKNCFVLSATHFPALKSYALTKPGVRAASMLFNPETGKPLFKLAYDQVGASQALLVAAEHGLPAAILEKARHYLLQDGGDSATLLARLNALAVEREKALADLKIEDEKARNILRDKKEKLDRERTRLVEETRAKIADLMHAWKEGRATAKQSLREMSRVRASLAIDRDEKEKSVLPAIESFTVGQEVLHTAFNKRGVITDIDERKNRARLDLNGVSLWAEMKDLRLPGQNFTPPASSGATIKSSSAPAALSLDVRGLRANEALSAVERFLDKALLAGHGTVEIVHGRGTGALRREIHAFLRSFPAVAEITLAPEDRGGDGMTIVTLK